MTTKSETIYESKTKHLRYLFDEQGNALPIYNDILDKFTAEEKAYYAGMIDGDGSIQYLKRKDRPGKKLKIVLELKEVNAEPLTELANIFDLSVRRKIYDVKTNTQPTLVCEFGKAKAEVFLFMVYPHLLEKNYLLKIY